MIFEYDLQKSIKNQQERGLPFSLVESFDFETAFIEQDSRVDYGEPRFKALGLLHQRVHCVIFCIRQSKIRIISFRKANAREEKIYEINRR